MWTGQQAVQNGLVDALGGLDIAVSLAKERAKIPADTEVELVTFPPRRSFYEVLSDEWAGNGADRMAVSAWMAANLTASERELLRALRGPFTLFRSGEMLAMMPYGYLR